MIGHTIAAPPDRSLIVIRDDTTYVAAALAARLLGHADVTWPVLITTLTDAYRRFQAELHRALRDYAPESARPDLHLVDGVAVGREIRARIRTARAVSLDPLVTGVTPLNISRSFEPGGRVPGGLVARPGSPPIASQTAHLRRTLGGEACVLVEDDIYTGGTITGVLTFLADAGIRVAKVVAGIIAGPVAPDSLGVPVEAVLRYTGAADRIDIADPRNFLLGVSGLVVRLPTGGWGRVPYWLPFVATSARVTTDPARDTAFAQAMVRANARFYEQVEHGTRCRIRIRHLDPEVRTPIVTTGTGAAETPVRHLLDALAARLERGDCPAEANVR